MRAAYAAMCGAAKLLPVTIEAAAAEPGDLDVHPRGSELHGRPRVVEPHVRVGDVVGGDGDDRREQRQVRRPAHVVGGADEQDVGEVGVLDDVVEQRVVVLAA